MKIWCVDDDEISVGDSTGRGLGGFRVGSSLNERTNYVKESMTEHKQQPPNKPRDIVGATGGMLSKGFSITGKLLAKSAEKGAEKIHDGLKKASNEVRVKMDKQLLKQLDKRVLPLIKDTVMDDDMPGIVQTALSGAIVAIWPDIKEEVWAIYQDISLKYQPIPEGSPLPFYRLDKHLRAIYLYTLYPYDKSIWQQIKSPLWWFFTLTMMIPLYAVQPIVFLIEFLLRDKSDESQLVSFIMRFKSFQFVTVGVLHAVVGGLAYFRCVNFDSKEIATGADVWRHECDDSGPASWSAFYMEMVGFVFCSVLVLLAFLQLPYSTRKGQRQLHPDSAPRTFSQKVGEDIDDADSAVSYCCCGDLKPHSSQGGRLLQYLLYWEFLSFCTVVLLMLLALLTLRPYRVEAGDSQNFHLYEWQFKADLYFLTAAYGILSFPFLLFSLPLVSTLLLHIQPTAYNRWGECVPVMSVSELNERRKKKEREEARNAGETEAEEKGDGQV